MKLTPELCEVVGAIIGDGNLWTDGSRYRIAMTGHPKLDKKYFEYLWNLQYKLFGKAPYRMRIRQGAIRMCLQQKLAFTIINKLGICAGKGKALKVAIPGQITSAGWKYVKWTLRGIMDTDGTVFFSKKTYRYAIYPTLEISTSSRMLALQITNLLLERDFRPKFRSYKKEFLNEEYKVALYGSKMLNKWIDEVGFSNERHINKLVPHYSIKLYAAIAQPGRVPR